MTNGALFDTNSLLWFRNSAMIKPAAYATLESARQINRLYTSSISVWELVFAARKRHAPARPDLRGMSAQDWFNDAVLCLQIEVLDVDATIAAEAAEIAPLYGSGDPGDCFLIATAHIRNLALITRDARILDFASENPTYLSVVFC